MNRPVSLFDANQKKAQMLAASIVARLPDAGLWTGYCADEPLVGELRFANQLNYWRRDYPHAVLVFYDPVMHDIKEVDWGEETIIQAAVQERYVTHVSESKPVEYMETVSHTFSKTRSLLEAAKIGAELAIKASASAEYAGVKGGLEVSAKITAEYSRQWGEQSTESDTITRQMKVPANTSLTFEAIRSLNKTQREISARTDFEFGGIKFIDETGAGVNPPRIMFGWQSWMEFLAIGQGVASADKALYRNFMEHRLTDSELSVLTAPSDELVTWLAEYDNVIESDIRIA